MELLVMAAVVLVVGFGGWLVGRRTSGDRGPDPMIEIAASLRAGRRPEVGREASEGLIAMRDALESRWVTRNEEREQALREALGRITAFLREGVVAPLREALGKDEVHLRGGARMALGAIQDLEFFLREPLTPDETHNLVPVVQQVTREFTADWEIAVRLRAPDTPVRAHINRDSFMDALYLLLHNAGRFGGGETVDVTVSDEAGGPVVVVRDHGDGFTPEALERAHDLFYSTTDTGLGLGIPFARKVVESHGGALQLGNAEGGGGKVTLSLPRA